MRAVRYFTSGPASGRLELVELERPAPGPGEVLVRVRLSGVNPTDWKARTSAQRIPGVNHGFGWVVPNQDGAGEIEAVGDGVNTSRIGQRVWLYNAQWERQQGTAAQWIALPSEQAVPLPGNASFELGAGLGIPAMTAHYCLFADGGLNGASVLVHGGAGAVGHAAIELARHAGARVAATVSSSEKARLATAAGAELVLNYRTQVVSDAVRAWAPDGVQRVVEVDLDHNFQTDAAVVAPGGVISSYVSNKAPISPPWALWHLNAALRFVLVYTISDAARRQAVDGITAALEAGALSALPAIRFPLGETAAAHDAVQGGAMGKILIDVL
jgi:NADPH:quinone reductase